MSVFARLTPAAVLVAAVFAPSGAAAADHTAPQITALRLSPPLTCVADFQPLLPPTIVLRFALSEPAHVAFVGTSLPDFMLRRGGGSFGTGPTQRSLYSYAPDQPSLFGQVFPPSASLQYVGLQATDPAGNASVWRFSNAIFTGTLPSSRSSGTPGC